MALPVMLRLLPWTLLVGCTPDADPRQVGGGGPGGTTVPTGPVTTTVTTTTSTTGAPLTTRLDELGVQQCADPSARDSDPWHHLWGQTMYADEQTWGGGAILGDFRSANTLDMVLTGERTNQYHLVERATNEVGLTFDDVAPDMPDLAALNWAVGGAAADIDGDGHTDLVLTRWDNANRLLLNDGSGGLIDSTPPQWLIRTHKTQSVSIADIDGDGDLDVFFGNYGAKPPSGGDYSMPPAHPAELYRNDGNGAWTDMSARLPLAVHDGYTFMTGLHDLNGDTLPELLVWNDFSNVRPSQLGTNLGNFEFSFRDEWIGGAKMGVAVADLNGDDKPDYFLTSWRKNFMLQSGDAVGVPDTWIDSTDAWGLQAELETRQQDFGWGADFGDIDNDGDVDALAGYGYWLDWDEDNRSSQRDGLYEQTAPQVFEDRAAEWGLDAAGPTRAVLFADINRDGWLDVVKRMVGDLSQIKIARCGANHWLLVDLEAPAPNTDAVGATVKLTAGGVAQTRWIQPGSTSLYAGAPTEAHFGLGDLDTVDTLEVIWPDGERSVFTDVAADQMVRVVRQ